MIGSLRRSFSQAGEELDQGIHWADCRIEECSWPAWSWDWLDCPGANWKYARIQTPRGSGLHWRELGRLCRPCTRYCYRQSLHRWHLRRALASTNGLLDIFQTFIWSKEALLLTQPLANGLTAQPDAWRMREWSPWKIGAYAQKQDAHISKSWGNRWGCSHMVDHIASKWRYTKHPWNPFPPRWRQYQHLLQWFGKRTEVQQERSKCYIYSRFWCFIPIQTKRILSIHWSDPKRFRYWWIM